MQRAVTGVAAAASLLAAAGCAQPTDIDVVSAAETASEAGAAGHLTAAVARSSAESYRYEVITTRTGPGGDDGAELEVTTTGVVDGERRATTMHLGAALVGAPSTVPEDLDLTIDTVVDGPTIYMRDRSGQGGTGLGLFAEVTRLDGAWGRIELDRFPGCACPQGMVGAGRTDGSLYLDAVAGATDQHDLGASEVRGVAVEGTGGTITFRDLLLAGGTDPDAPVAELPEPGGIDGPDALDAVLDTEIPIEVWVDRDGFIRRVVVETDMSAVAGSIVGPGAPGAPLDLPGSQEVTDFFDYGDPSIEVAVPTESIDITDAVLGSGSIRVFPSSDAGPAG
jgi:hypothetical protein